MSDLTFNPDASTPYVGDGSDYLIQAAMNPEYRRSMAAKVDADLYMPTTDQVREAWWRDQCPKHDLDLDDKYNAAFNRWLAARDAGVHAQLAKDLSRLKRGGETLGKIVDRHIEDTLRWAGMEEQIGTEEPDQELAWERCSQMSSRIKALESEIAALRGGDAR